MVFLVRLVINFIEIPIYHAFCSFRVKLVIAFKYLLRIASSKGMKIPRCKPMKIADHIFLILPGGIPILSLGITEVSEKSLIYTGVLSAAEGMAKEIEKQNRLSTSGVTHSQHGKFNITGCNTLWFYEREQKKKDLHKNRTTDKKGDINNVN